MGALAIAVPHDRVLIESPASLQEGQSCEGSAIRQPLAESTTQSDAGSVSLLEHNPVARPVPRSGW
eukprot:2119942-Alexandrium_andersonii.AAC.1